MGNASTNTPKSPRITHDDAELWNPHYPELEAELVNRTILRPTRTILILIPNSLMDAFDHTHRFVCGCQQALWGSFLVPRKMAMVCVSHAVLLD